MAGERLRLGLPLCLPPQDFLPPGFGFRDSGDGALELLAGFTLLAPERLPGIFTILFGTQQPAAGVLQAPEPSPLGLRLRFRGL